MYTTVCPINDGTSVFKKIKVSECRLLFRTNLKNRQSQENPGRMSQSNHGSALFHTGACTGPSPVLISSPAAATDSTHPEGCCCPFLARTFVAFFWIGSSAHNLYSSAFCVFVWCAKPHLLGIPVDACSVLSRAWWPSLLRLFPEDHSHWLCRGTPWFDDRV